VARPKAFVFDAYGTLFDVHSVVEAGRAVTGDPQALSTLWRQKQLEYTWLRSLMGRYEDFSRVTLSALDWSFEHLQLEPDEQAKRALIDEYRRLAVFPEVPAAIAKLAQVKPLAILSNGSIEKCVLHLVDDISDEAIASAAAQLDTQLVGSRWGLLPELRAADALAGDRG